MTEVDATFDDEERRLQEQILLLREESAIRQGDDPWWKWQPNLKQEPFIRAILQEECGEAWMFAANRSGKTDAAAFAGASLARFGRRCPRYQIGMNGQFQLEDYSTSGWVVSLDFPNSRDVVQPKFFNNGFGKDASHDPFIPEREIYGGSVEKGWSVTNQILRLKNGSIIGFKSADSGRAKFQGSAKDWIMFDEEPQKDIYEESVIRVGGGRQLQIFGACTLLPAEGQAGGVSWLFPEKIKPWQSGKKVEWQIFTASIYDNPHLNPKEITRLEAMYPEGSVQRAIRLYGELRPGLSGARAYAAFDSRIHVKEQGVILPRRPLCWVWDFNVSPLITLVGQRQGKMFRFHKEIFLEDGSIPEMCDAFMDLYPQHQGEIWVYGDATGKHRHPQSKRSNYSVMMACMMRYGSPVRMKVKESNPPVSSRINAFNMQLRDENAESNIEIDPECVEFIADLEQVLLDGRGGIKKTHNRKDPYSRRTHSSDAAGYWIAYEEPVKLPQSDEQREQTHVPSPQYAFGSKPR